MKAVLKRLKYSRWRIYLPILLGLALIFGLLRVLVWTSKPAPTNTGLGLENVLPAEPAEADAEQPPLPTKMDLSKLAEALPETKLVPAWELKMAGNGFLTLADDKLYVATTAGEVKAVDTASGATLWTYNVGAWMASRPAVSGGVVYVGSTDHTLYALDARTGVLIWYFKSQGEILSSPVVDGNLVFIYSDNNHIYDLMNRVYALDAATGTLLWYFDTKAWMASSPTPWAGHLYLGCYNRVVYALDQRTGEERWTFPTRSLVFSSPGISGDQVVCCAIDGRVYSISEVDGKEKWSRSLQEFIWLSPVVYTAPDGPALILVGTYNNAVYAIHSATGAVPWAAAVGGKLEYPPQVLDNRLAVFNGEGRIYLLKAADGALLAALRAPYDFSSLPQVSTDHLYACSADGYLRAYALPPSPTATSALP